MRIQIHNPAYNNRRKNSRPSLNRSNNFFNSHAHQYRETRNNIKSHFLVGSISRILNPGLRVFKYRFEFSYVISLRKSVRYRIVFSRPSNCFFKSPTVGVGAALIKMASPAPAIQGRVRFLILYRYSLKMSSSHRQRRTCDTSRNLCPSICDTGHRS